MLPEKVQFIINLLPQMTKVALDDDGKEGQQGESGRGWRPPWLPPTSAATFHWAMAQRFDDDKLI